MDELIHDIAVITLQANVLFPKCIMRFEVNKELSVSALTSALKFERNIFVVLQKDPFVYPAEVSNVYTHGTIAKVLQVTKGKNNSVTIVCEGLQLGKIVSPKDKALPFADVQVCNFEIGEDIPPHMAMMKTLRELHYEYVSFKNKIMPDFFRRLESVHNLMDVAYLIAGDVDFDPVEKQELLKTRNKDDFATTLICILRREIAILSIQEEIYEKTQRKMDEHQRNFFLNEEIRTIQEELGESDEDELDEYRKKIKKAKMPENNKKSLLKECAKLEKLPLGSQEGSLIRTYIEACLELPWGIYAKESCDLDRARKVLDKQHYGLEKVKEKIIQRLAVKILNPEGKAQILCLVGPPGVGKTSIAQSIAKAIKRPCQRISLGGVRDEAEIRGHRRTYLGAMCGRIMDAIKKSEASNPLIILDEIDKLASDYKGDPSSALLEVMDSEQNNTFYDHYYDMPYDLSSVMFITTANDANEIPRPLLDRMDVIEIGSYTREEKFHIAKKHLIPKQLKNCGIKSTQVKFDSKAIYQMIDCYTREAGVRNLERTIEKILNKLAVTIVEDAEAKIKIDVKKLGELLGTPKFKPDVLSKNDEIGVATGLAWTSVGGEVLPIEVAVMTGTGKTELTGSLGDVMQESAKTAISCVRSNADKYKIDIDFYKNKDIHIHAPEGAVPKDGPSAGITMATAIMSALTNIPIKHNVAMTGEITLRGRVLPIGGLKEKSMAAYKLGIDTVIIPEDNMPDLELVDSVVKENIKFVPVKSIDEVLNTALTAQPYKNS